MNHGLSAEIVESLNTAFSHYAEINRVLLFGSRANGHFKGGSDIDLAVLAPAMNEIRFTALWNDIDSLPILFKIDLLHWDTLGNIRLKEKILQEGKVLYPAGA
jgi:predicted nucleotidyltransferase